ncbi:DUF2748 domain-containing protein [bacterium]|nr:DUF2748 domain-containing protein [bacterium]
MSNVYDVLAQRPALSRETLFVELEELAERLVKSGRFRVDAGDRINFIRFSHPAWGIYKIFSKRELTDPKLVPVTLRYLQELLEKRYEPHELEAEAKNELARLQREIGKFIEVPEETEMKLARAIVQATHPAVMMLILWEEVQVFVAYGHTVGDMLDIEGWQKMGSSSGLQSTAGRRDYCIYTSAGGDPFHTGEHASPHDGQAALARLMVIAAQEMGHFADIRRGSLGEPVSRHSANISVTQATDQVRLARLNDLKHAKQLQQQLAKLGLDEGMKLEQSAQFYAKHRAKDRIAKSSAGKAKRYHQRFLAKALKSGFVWLKQMPASSQPMTDIGRMLDDMLFNLAPEAEAYRRADPVVQEAIACAEALARVPQQAVKWSHKITIALWPAMYNIYYGQVIPAVVASYEQISGQKYRFSYTKPAPARRIWWKFWR